MVQLVQKGCNIEWQGIARNRIQWAAGLRSKTIVSPCEEALLAA